MLSINGKITKKISSFVSSVVTEGKTMAYVFRKKFLTEPKQLIKLIVLIICVVFTIYQLIECVKKIVHPPASTHYNFFLNKTIKYPCLTICRRPAYKTTLFSNFGLRPSTQLNAQNAFLNFNFQNHTIQEFFDETSYRFDDLFVQYAYAGIGSHPNLTVVPSYHLMRGICYTLIPRVQSDIFSISGGYFLYLRHDTSARDIDEYGVSKAGFQMYLHDSNEILTYEDDQRDSFLEYLYLEASEEMNVVLNVQTYGKISTKDHGCITDPTYSKSKCLEYCVHRQVAETAGCTLPFLSLPDNLTFPECSDFPSVRDLITDFRIGRTQYMRNCNCPMACNITVYSTKIVNRREMDELNAPNSIISLYYSSNLVTKVNEVIGYDWNQFLSDIGGSLGFLLGLSVIGLITMVEEICHIIFRWIFTKKVKRAEEHQQEQLGKQNKDTGDVRDYGESSGCNDERAKDLGKEDHSYKNLMEYFTDYSYYEKNLVDKVHDNNNKF
ncbi:hypothetical protein NQ317_013432 [Molorchus minor]|uniref:Uncharacterized protein n=1 Tax=Molorchus minor TaxID=1323400 RepID=A0ABQ9JUG0_9CUCU|nr:hypothetical protein NQ317_013432 [Molorchus minor]